MSLALWTTGDANLYLPSVQTASVFRKPQRVTTVICGVLGTILGLGIYQHFMDWINLLATLVPPLIGPVIADYYIVNRMHYNAEHLTRLPRWNPAAVIAYVVGAVAAYAGSANWLPDAFSALFPSLLGLLASIAAYLICYYAAAAAGVRLGHARVQP